MRSHIHEGFVRVDRICSDETFSIPSQCCLNSARNMRWNSRRRYHHLNSITPINSHFNESVARYNPNPSRYFAFENRLNFQPDAYDLFFLTLSS